MQKRTFSIIVPVFNTEKYIDDCLNSFLNQTFQDFEVICIDDNSSDLSVEKVMSFAKKDERIKLIKHRKNKGPGAARNTGMKHAAGKYILFVDSDDWIHRETLEILQEKFENTKLDSIWFKLAIYYDDIKKYNNLDDNIYAKIPEGYLKLTPENAAMYPSYTCNKAYRRKFLEKHKLTWPEGCYYEDAEFYYKIIPLLSKVYVVNQKFYIYRKRNGSICDTCDKDYQKYSDLYSVVFNIYKYYKRKKLLKKYKITFLQFLSNVIEESRKHREIFKALSPIIKNTIKEIGFPEKFEK